MVGLKIDRNRAINERDVATFARSKGVKFVEVSAMEGKNLQALIKELATNVM